MKPFQNRRQPKPDQSRRISILEKQVRILQSKNLDFIDSADVCRQLHISKRDLAYLRESGDLPYIKSGKKILFDPADIRIYLLTRKIFKNRKP